MHHPKSILGLKIGFGLVIVALLLVIPMSVLAAHQNAAPAAAVSAPAFAAAPMTATISVVGMYPAMGEVLTTTGRPTGIMVPRGDNPKANYAVFGPGTKNVPPGVPAYVEAGALGIAEGAKLKDFAWTLKGPAGSTAKIVAVAKPVPGLTTAMATFTPDKEGEYVVGLTVTDDKGAKGVPAEITMVAAKYVGSEACQKCHKDKYEGWKATQHGTAFQRFVNENAEGEYFTVGFGCARCHTVGYYPVKTSTGGWWDVFVNQLKLDWVKSKIKDKIALNAFNEEKGKDTFSGFDPKLQTVSNIGCESCHGPAGAHVVAPSKDTAPMANADSRACDQCHNAGGHHTRGGAMANSAHSTNADLGEGNRTPCNACHSSEGHIDTVNGVEKPRMVNSNLGCPACHDPHSAKTPFQLRVVDSVKLPTGEVKGFGLSATCMSCHNNRTKPESVDTDTPGNPHYSSAAEQIAGIGGYDFGVTLRNSYHVNLGKSVINDEKSNQPGTATNFIWGGEAPGACLLCHMSRTPGGTWDTLDSMKVPGHQQVGGHTFNTVFDVDGKEIQNVEPCQQCHPGITEFNFASRSDYDGNGKMEGVQTEVKGLLDLLKAAIIEKAKAEKIDLKIQDGNPYFVFPAGAKRSVELKGAVYNFRYVNGVMWTGEGKASTIHNYARSVGLLQISYMKLTGKDVPNATIRYTAKK